MSVPRMGAATVAALRTAIGDPVVVARYRSHILIGDDTDDTGCRLWTGAISEKGHGRFQVGDTYVIQGDGSRRRVTFVVIAHRFGYALAHGVDALLRTPMVAHWCDNPLCQNPRHWRASDHAGNRREFIARRGTVLGPLADMRGARGRARALRDAARAGTDLTAVDRAGAAAAHRDQLAMFDQPCRTYGVEPDETTTTDHDEGHHVTPAEAVDAAKKVDAADAADGRAVGEVQRSLFGDGDLDGEHVQDQG